MLECVVNVSEGRRAELVERIGRAAGDHLLDLHSDADHNRSVLTLGGPDVEAAAFEVTTVAVELLDVTSHGGAHPRLGVVDVVPFVPVAGAGGAKGDPLGAGALGARDRFAGRAGGELGLPCFLYGPERPLPEVRRRAFSSLPPDTGPDRPHPSAGAACVGARTVLVAYNVWLAAPARLERARAAARELRGPAVRALAFDLGGRLQLSFNLVVPAQVGPAEIFDAVAARLPVSHAELVGLVPAQVVASTPASRWAELDLDPARTIEARLEAAGWA